MGMHGFKLYDLIVRNAQVYGDRRAWTEAETGVSISFAQYCLDVQRLSAGLQGMGIRHCQRIAAIGHNSYEFFVLYGAAAALGAIIVPINWRLAEEEVRYILVDVSPAAIFADEDFQTTVDALKEDLPKVKHFCNLMRNQGRYRSWEELQATEPHFEPAEKRSQDGYVIIHTAAVSGRPRGALLTHANLMSSNMQNAAAYQIAESDVHLNLLPLFHVAGLLTAMAAFHAGVHTVNMTRFDAPQAVQLICDHKVTFFFDFAPILGAILEASDNPGDQLGSLRWVAGLDGPDTIQQLQQTTGAKFYVIYGQTETSGLATVGAYDDCPGAAGKAAALASVQLLDDDGAPVDTGEIGEIVVRGPVIFKGYWKLPEDTAYTFRSGWHHTGDLGAFDDQGNLFYKGRKADKDLVKTGGENVYPAEVERVLMEHPGIEKAVVFGVPDPKWGEAIKAVCQTQGEGLPSAEEVIRFVGSQIAGFKKPKFVEFVEAMPLTKDGVPDRNKVQADFS